MHHYFKISKIRQKFQNSPIVKRITSQEYDVKLDACMQYENFSIKTVGEEAFYSNYISYDYFKISKIRQNLKKSDRLKKHRPGEWYHTKSLYAISKLSD